MTVGICKAYPCEAFNDPKKLKRIKRSSFYSKKCKENQGLWYEEGRGYLYDIEPYKIYDWEAGGI